MIISNNKKFDKSDLLCVLTGDSFTLAKFNTKFWSSLFHKPMHAMIRTNEVCYTSHLSFTSSSKMLQNTFWTKMFHTRILYMSDEKRAFCAFQNTVQFWGNHAWPDNILNVPKNALTLSGTWWVLSILIQIEHRYCLSMIVINLPYDEKMLINTRNAINLWNLEIDFKS